MNEAWRWCRLGCMAKLTSRQMANAVRGAAMFSALTETEMAELLRVCPVRNIKAGGRIFSPSQAADSFYVILAGKVKVYKLSPRGDEQILHLYGPGQTFGEAAMWARVRYPAFAGAVTDAAVLSVGQRALKNLAARNAELMLGMLAGMSAKLREFNQLIGQLSLQDVPARLAGALLELPARVGTNTVVLGHTKRELAAQIGAVPETLSRALKKLRSMGLIEVAGAKITLISPEGLAELAEG